MHISGGEADSIATSHKAASVRVCRTFPAAVFGRFLRKSDHLQPLLRWPKLAIFHGKSNHLQSSRWRSKLDVLHGSHAISRCFGGNQNCIFLFFFFFFLWWPKQVFYAKPWCLPNPDQFFFFFYASAEEENKYSRGIENWAWTNLTKSQPKLHPTVIHSFSLFLSRG